jgi:hypothetical protein
MIGEIKEKIDYLNIKIHKIFIKIEFYRFSRAFNKILV